MRYLVVHSHLYQPPRENPWTEEIERQPSAAPFHDWNERVSDECYERLGGAAVPGPDSAKLGLLNLYGRMSFNIGPTLFAWLETHRPDVLEDARAGFREAQSRTGSGNALMQPFGHAILPLCEPREKRLQIAWGRADYRHRFGVEPEGIWFSETAVDTPSLDEAARQGLRFTIVAPEQVRRIRPLAGGEWVDVSGERVPAHRPYLVRLNEGRSIVVFPFDGTLSRGAAFGGALARGESMLGAFRGAIEAIPEEKGLVLLAADGETFGHHQKGSEEILAEGLVRARMTGLARVTHLGEVLRDMPPEWEAELFEPSAWSCQHGVGRWERDCGCGDHGLGPGWQRAWRGPLRHGVSVLRDRVFAAIDRRGGELFEHPWQAFEDFGDVIVRPPSLEAVQGFVDRHARRDLGEADKRRAAELLELVRQTLFSATSCGWFFDDIAGIEPIQVMRHAARAIELARRVFDIDLEPNLEEALSQARSNKPGEGHGDTVFRRHARSARRDGRTALGLHAVRRLGQVLCLGEGPAAPAASSHGAYAVSDRSALKITREGSATRIEGLALATHRRTGESLEARFVIEEAAPGARPSLVIEGEEHALDASPVSQALVDLAAQRALAELTPPDLSILDRHAGLAREAREVEAALPSPFPEVLRAVARALVGQALVQSDPNIRLNDLPPGLRACRDAGFAIEDLEDVRRSVDRAISADAGALAARFDEDALGALVSAIEAARDVLGDRAIARVRRWIVSRPEGVPEAQLEALAAAAGLAPEALDPIDAPVRPFDDEDRQQDALL